MATVTPQSVQAKLDVVKSELAKTGTKSYSAMVKSYGSNWRTWPKTSSWYLALSALSSARADVSKLTVPTLTADFTEVQT